MEKIIHQIWIGPYQMPDKEVYSIQTMKDNNPDFQHILWTDANLPELHPAIVEKVNHFRERKIYAFAADVLRIALVYEYGGIYADVDWITHKGFEDLHLENHNGLIVYHNGHYTTGNEFFGCKSKYGFIKQAYDYLINTSEIHDYTPNWFNAQLRNYYQVEDIVNYSDPVTAEITGKQLLQKLTDDSVISMIRRGEFEEIYATHVGLHSWATPHREYFEQGNINYQETIYNVKYK